MTNNKKAELLYQHFRIKGKGFELNIKDTTHILEILDCDKEIVITKMLKTFYKTHPLNK